MKEGTRVLVALGLAILFGAVIASSGNARALQVADAVAPIGILWVTAIRMTVIPLLVALIVTGVASASDVRDIGRMGARALAVFLALLIGAAVIVIPTAPLLFSLMPSGARPALPAGAVEAAREVVSGGQTPTFASWLTSLLPSNPINAAANGAMVPFILFVLLFAIAVARSSTETRTTLVVFFRALGDAMMTLVRGVIWLAPIGVFAMVLPLTAHAGASMAGAIGFYIAAYALLTLLVIALLYPAVAIFGGIPMRRFAKAALPAQLIAFSSSSSLAALPALVEAAEDSLALPTNVTGFMLPLGAAMFKLAAPATWTAGALFIAWFYNVPMHAPELLTIALASVFLGFASPGIPRGGFIMLTPLLLAVGLPVEGVGILIAVDAIPDTIATALNVTGNLAATVLVAHRTRKRSGVAPSPTEPPRPRAGEGPRRRTNSRLLVE